MKELGFQVCCPSCETTFEVTDPELVGQIVACPKCGGMMKIEAAVSVDEESEEVDGHSGDSVEGFVSESSPFGTSGINRASLFRDERRVMSHSSDSTSFLSEDNFNHDDLENQSAEDDGEDVQQDDLLDDKRSVLGSRWPFVVSGVVCALIAALVCIFLKAHRVPPVDSGAHVAQSRKQDGHEELIPSIANGIYDLDDAVVSDIEGIGKSENDTSMMAELESQADVLSSGQIDTTEVKKGDNDDPEALVNEVIGEGGEPQGVVEALDLYQDNGEDLWGGEVVNVVGEDYNSDEENDLASGDESIPSEFDVAVFEKENQVPDEDDSLTDEEDLGAVASTFDVSLDKTIHSFKSEPKEIDIDSRLKLPIRSLDYPESPVAAVRLLSEFAGIPIEFDLERMTLLRPSLNMRLNLKIENTDVAAALNKEAEILKWNIEKQIDRVVLKPLEYDPSAIVEQRFEVDDILAVESPFLMEISANVQSDSASNERKEAPSPNSLIRLVKSLVDPQKWEMNDGKTPEATIVFEDSSIVVTSDSVTREKVGNLLGLLRVLRQLELKNGVSSDSLIPESLGWDYLNRKTPFNLLKPTSLQQAIDILEGKFKFLSIWDDAALNAIGVGRDSSTAARIESSSVEQIIETLLEPLKLTYIILDEKVILITTKEKADTYETVEIHGFSSVKDPKSLNESIRITEEMKSIVAPDSWNNPNASIWLDVDTGCWIVRQTQPVQREIRRWTSELLLKESRVMEKKKAN